MNFTKLVLGDALDGLDLAGLSRLGFAEDLPADENDLRRGSSKPITGTSDSESNSSSEAQSQESEFELQEIYQKYEPDIQLVEHVYKMSDMLIPRKDDKLMEMMKIYLDRVTGFS